MVINPISDGMGPVRLLLHNDMFSNLGINPNSVGRAPLSLLLQKISCVNSFKRPNSVGNSPVKPFSPIGITRWNAIDGMSQ